MRLHVADLSQMTLIQTRDFAAGSDTTSLENRVHGLLYHAVYTSL